MTWVDFEEWLNEVSIEVVAMVGVRAMDLPDQPYRDWFNDGVEPQEAAEMVLEAGL